MRPFLMPAFFNAGRAAAAAEMHTVQEGHEVALLELRSMLLWCLQKLGLLTRAEVRHVHPKQHPL